MQVQEFTLHQQTISRARKSFPHTKLIRRTSEMEKNFGVQKSIFFVPGGQKSSKSIFSTFSKEYEDLRKSWILVEKTDFDHFWTSENFFRRFCLQKKFRVVGRFLKIHPKFVFKTCSQPQNPKADVPDFPKNSDSIKKNHF